MITRLDTTFSQSDFDIQHILNQEASFYEKKNSPFLAQIIKVVAIATGIFLGLTAAVELATLMAFFTVTLVLIGTAAVYRGAEKIAGALKRISFRPLTAHSHSHPWKRTGVTHIHYTPPSSALNPHQPVRSKPFSSAKYRPNSGSKNAAFGSGQSSRSGNSSTVAPASSFSSKPHQPERCTPSPVRHSQDSGSKHAAFASGQSDYSATMASTSPYSSKPYQAERSTPTPVKHSQDSGFKHAAFGSGQNSRTGNSSTVAPPVSSLFTSSKNEKQSNRASTATSISSLGLNSLHFPSLRAHPTLASRPSSISSYHLCTSQKPFQTKAKPKQEDRKQSLTLGSGRSSRLSSSSTTFAPPPPISASTGHASFGGGINVRERKPPVTLQGNVGFGSRTSRR